MGRAASSKDAPVRPAAYRRVRYTRDILPRSHAAPIQRVSSRSVRSFRVSGPCVTHASLGDHRHSRPRDPASKPQRHATVSSTTRSYPQVSQFDETTGTPPARGLRTPAYKWPSPELVRTGPNNAKRLGSGDHFISNHARSQFSGRLPQDLAQLRNISMNARARGRDRFMRDAAKERGRHSTACRPMTRHAKKLLQNNYGVVCTPHAIGSPKE